MNDGASVAGGVLRAVNTRGWGLSVTFRRQRDRFEQQIEFVDGAATTPCLVSVEGAAGECWPPSPPWQQFSVAEPRPGQRVALLLGMARRSHWSFSVEAQVDPPRLIFDVACRLAEPPGWLGSTYQAADSRLVMAPDGLRVLAANGAAATVACGHRTLAGTGPVDDCGAPAELSLDGGRLTIRPAQIATRPPATVRWRYLIERL